MTPIELARQEWEANTTPCPKVHTWRRGDFIVEFRKYGSAIAFLKWDNAQYIEISKFEKLPNAKRHDPTRLIEFLKMLSGKYKVQLFGNPVKYQPAPPTPIEPLRSQEDLENWYRKLGFTVQGINECLIPQMWFPNPPNV